MKCSLPTTGILTKSIKRIKKMKNMNKMKIILPVVLIAAVVLFSVYIKWDGTPQSRALSGVLPGMDEQTPYEPLPSEDPLAYKEIAINECIDECKQALREGVDLNNGPCLRNEFIDEWVCDVAHNPRQDVDNDPANQCPAYMAAEAHHFVEVGPECELIRSI